MGFFNDTATTEIYTLSLRVALPIFIGDQVFDFDDREVARKALPERDDIEELGRAHV